MSRAAAGSSKTRRIGRSVLCGIAMLVDLRNNGEMTPPQSTSRVIFSQVACTCFRVLGGLALLTATWEFVRLAGGLATHLTSVAAWIHTFFTMTLIVVWGAAGMNLLRGRTFGWCTLCVLTCFSILSCGFQPASFLHPWLCLWLGPLPLAADDYLTGPLAILFVLLLIATRIAVSFAGPPGPPLSGWTCLRRIALVPALALLFAGWWRVQESLELAGQNLVQEALSASREEQGVRAEVIWERVIAEYPFTMAWVGAVFTHAQQRQAGGQYYEAIATYKMLLGCRSGDCTPAHRLFVSSRLQRNSACIGLAECYESLGDYRQALHYARLADTTYHCRSGCGTCDDSMRKEAEKRVARLQELVE
jgi:hypothetical protein